MIVQQTTASSSMYTLVRCHTYCLLLYYYSTVVRVILELLFFKQGYTCTRSQETTHSHRCLQHHHSGMCHNTERELPARQHSTTSYRGDLLCILLFGWLHGLHVFTATPTINTVLLTVLYQLYVLECIILKVLF